MRRRIRRAQSGFSLIETLIAMALMGVIVGALATITGQWLPNWHRGFVSVQSKQLLERGLDRITADISAAEYVPLSGETSDPFFIGSERSITFVRRSIGPNTTPGLELVRIGELADQRGAALVRTRTRFVPARNADLRELPPFVDPVVLLRTPYRVTFSYAGKDRAWKNTWDSGPQLPRTVRILIRDQASQKLLPDSTVATIHVDAPPPCQSAKQDPGCQNETAAQQKDGDEPISDSDADAQVQE
jgi:general secretion pathway protein J